MKKYDWTPKANCLKIDSMNVFKSSLKKNNNNLFGKIVNILYFNLKII